MSIVMTTPGIHELREVAQVLQGWQHDGGPLHLHPGDLGWHSMKGAAATAAALRLWSRDGRGVAVGLLDGPQLLRMAFAPDLEDDEEVARRVVTDAGDPARGVLAAGSATIEARGAPCFSRLLARHGWQPDELWTPMHRDLSSPVGDLGARVETIGPDRAGVWLEVHWSAFRGAPFTETDRRRLVDRWLDMAAGPFSAGSRFLAAFDPLGNAVAAAAVWSAGPGRPGLVEPMGVHRDHRGRGYGTAITCAAASALRTMGASSAIVCAESSNVGAVSTYTAAGFIAEQEVADLQRVA
ncbi:GNAT family N-acetyltransferase [Cellulomonas dongxiuzhuiae]|uniref:GNAT family N-acetyltransferase n=2 Tax=Cellulomonas dongxiuzhuiae TaxID=2819979 RepID=A0ABX8GMH8_9CELL|nr:GNAT family N-acetyltransferase [Cellulomonas dongxiuzhuiae]MBO3095463.1 GNAT family N-acetyltransferase [Cellulomonas dongxiuzhuiae]QWC16444.1 GNAT family N-acetyltransferase [Cellulomonas dongxiuzhuiae]